MKNLIVHSSGFDSMLFKTYLVDEKHLIRAIVKGQTELDAEEKAIELKRAFNHTIGIGINPESVGEMKKALEEILQSYKLYVKKSDESEFVINAEKALEKSKL